MICTRRGLVRVLVLPLLVALSGWLLAPAQATLKTETFWQVEEVKPGMKGQGRTVIKGTKIESFDAEVIGVLRNTSPGRDMVLCRLSGLNLEKTGVIAGMSGSPVYLQGKLLGAVAYAWAFGKEPIAGVTPFVQMHQFVESYERRDLAEKDKTRRIGLAIPLDIGPRRFETVTVSNDFSGPQPTAADGLWMVPLRTPLAASGMSAGSLFALKNNLADLGMMPVQGGGVAGNIPEEERNIPLQPGGALSVALITGDFDLSGIGTVTHIEGKRVYGWGHPFFGMGACELPLMTGYVHTIYPRQSLSFKMGSPLRTVGLINADVSTCIAGWLDRSPDMLPVSMTVLRDQGSASKTFNVRIVRQRSLLGGLVLSALTNSIDMEGDLPEEMTALLKVRVDVEGHEPIVVNDVFSGSSVGGTRAQALFNQVALLVNTITYNPIGNLRIKRIDCTTEILPGRRNAEIESVELDNDSYAPGDTVKATVFLRPYKGQLERIALALPLPADLPEGTYTGTITDDLAQARQELRDNPNLLYPTTMEHLFSGLEVLTSAKRTSLALRVPTAPAGVAMNGKTLPNLPASMVQILASNRRTGVQQIPGSLVQRQATAWVVQGSDTIRFQVSKNKNVEQ